MSKIIKFNSYTRKQIEDWDNNHAGYENEYEDILEALETDSMQSYISRVLVSQTHYEPNERFSYVLTGDNDEILGFTFFYLNYRQDDKYDMFVQSIVVNPKYRRKGYAKELLGTIFANPEQYITVRPVDVAGFVFPWNAKSLEFFDNFAEFERHRYGRKFYLIISDYKTIEQNAKMLLKNDNDMQI